MKTPTYKEQFDKLTAAYIENRVRPYDACACFIGNLLDGERNWVYGRNPTTFQAFRNDAHQNTIFMCSPSLKEAFDIIKEKGGGFYEPQELYHIEDIFMSHISGNTETWERIAPNARYERVLFEAFTLALEALRELHISKGEEVDKSLTLTKRQLTCVS